MQRRPSLVLAIVAALLVARAEPARAGDGRGEISQAVVLAAGGFPYVITAPGSYVLTSDLTPTAGGLGIRIDVDDVDIDLNGFAIRGGLVCVPGSCAGTGASVAIGVPTSPVTNGRRCAVRNGRILGVSQAIELRDEAFVDSVAVSNTFFHGIVLGPNSLVTRARVTSVGRSALVLGAGSGYGQNVFARTGQFFAFGSVFGGEPIGENVCDDDRCGGARRRFYLTQALVNGAGALTACDAGFHMASRWEILDTSGVRYDVARGQTREDAGQGPPIGRGGWIRTGNTTAPSGTAAFANCTVWQNGATGFGTVISLDGAVPSDDVGGATELGWAFGTASCNSTFGVWCVEDD